MKKWSSISRVALASSLFAVSSSGFAYDSGSTGADGAFSPTASQRVQLPPDGVFNYSSVNIPAGVTITYINNVANTPVTILSSGDVTIAGTIDVSATPPADISGAGLAGPGGYNGGSGGQPAGVVLGWASGYGYSGINIGRAGMGPGGGAPGAVVQYPPNWGAAPALAAGGGAGYGSAPAAAGGPIPTTPGVTYGNLTLIPLIGGSGGGGGVGGALLTGSGGGGGGGAILIASSGTLNMTGAVLANGGVPVNPVNADGRGSRGGGGSGGAIRLIATTVSGNGTISAVGGANGGECSWMMGQTYLVCDGNNNGSSYGGLGRIRIEAENLARTAASNPPWVGAAPSLVFVPGLPTLKIDSIGSIAVPAQPTGSGDVALPTGFTNPVTVTFVTSGVTVGSSIMLTVIPEKGAAFSATSAPTTGSTSSATASVSVTLQPGSNTLQASVTYTVVASVGDAMSIYAQGERVEKITLASTFGSQESKVTLISVSGKEYVVPASALARLPS